MQQHTDAIRFGCGLLLIIAWFALTVSLVVRCTATHAASSAPRIQVTCQHVIIDTSIPRRVLIEYIRPDRISANGLQSLAAGRTRLRHNAAIGTTLRVSMFPQTAGLAQGRETTQVPRCRWLYPLVGGG